MPEFRDHGHPDHRPPVPLHLATTGPVVLVRLPVKGELQAWRVICGCAAGGSKEEQVADARELLDALGLGVTRAEVEP
jgi:hypothetical protein